MDNFVSESSRVPMSVTRFFTCAAENNDLAAPTTLRHGEKRSFTARADWSEEAVEAFEIALASKCPVDLTPVEENTLPSWLWQRQAASARTENETDARQVFNRVAGAATYRGWKAGLWRDEASAICFFDEIRFLLSERLIALPPSALGKIGLGWAYGKSLVPAIPARVEIAKPVDLAKIDESPIKARSYLLNNKTIDSLLRNDDLSLRAKWNKMLRQTSVSDRLDIRFQDTAHEWDDAQTVDRTPRLALDLLRFLRADGAFDVAALQAAARFATFLLDLSADDLGIAGNPARPLAIGFVNLAAALMALGIAYDSPKGRTTAGALTALLSAECHCASADLAAALGPCPAYREKTEMTRRAMRNRHRAAQGEKSDFERLSILPPVLEVSDDTDLVLVSAARHGWDVALEKLDRYGLRNMELFSLFEDAEIMRFLESAAPSYEPEASLLREALVDAISVRSPSPAFQMRIRNSGLDPAEIAAAYDYLCGTHSFAGAPGLSPADLKRLGFDEPMIAKLESMIPSTTRLSLLFTPWIIGDTYCRERLKIKSKALFDPSFNLLEALGVDETTLRAAEATIYGHKSIDGFLLLSKEQKAVFATRDMLNPFVQIKMAAAIQPFLSNDIKASLSVSQTLSRVARGEILFAAWREGLRSLSLFFEGTAPEESARTAIKLGKIAKIIKTKGPHMPTPMPRSRKVTSTMVQVKTVKQKATATAETVSLKRSVAKRPTTARQR